ncbi:hypothetical protein ACFVVA_18230 [Kitasatospora sp. NPDC058048]|uniref:hypothetical protein n=1 Tax=Kitasatospora sp. NPDC058048 TaxID=3346313 RepID=UPI0036DCF34E
MSAALLLDRPETPNPTHGARQPGNVPNSDRTTSAMACPICGSGATYQTMDGRWGCTVCGSTWA